MTVRNERWDWWNKYTRKDELIDMMIVSSGELGRWPDAEEVTEIWPAYTLRMIQEEFGSYDLMRQAAAEESYRRAQGYRSRKTRPAGAPKLSPEQRQKIAEIKARPSPIEKPAAIRESMLPERPIQAEVPRDTQTETVPMVVLGMSQPVQLVVQSSQTVSQPTMQPQRRKCGRKPTYSDEQLLGLLRQMVSENNGQVPTMAQAKVFLKQQEGAPSLMTMTNRLGPMAGWERKLEEAS